MKINLKRALSLFLVISLLVSMLIPGMQVKAVNHLGCIMQWETKWKNYTYGTGNLYDTGCGIFALVNSVGYLTGKRMDVISVASWAHDIKAYNVTGSEGTYRGTLYPKVEGKYGKEYGFTVDCGSENKGYWENSSSATLKNHLSKGGVAIGHVPNHFIAIVGYDANANKYHVYDSAPSTARGTKANGGDVWVTQAALNAGKLKLDWFCLLSYTGSNEIATLDINGYLDGVAQGGLSNYGTFDVWINGSLVADNVNDYCVDWPVGTQYEITDIKATDIHKYLGVGAGSLSGTIGAERTDVYLQFRTLDNIGDDFYAYIISKDNGSYAHNQGDQNVTAPLYIVDNELEQIWHFQRLEDGTYKITSAWNGRSLDVQGYGNTPGTNLISMPYVGNDAQKWCIFEEAAGCKLSAVCTPCVVAVNTATGNIQMEHERNERFDQWFTIQKIPSDYYTDVNGLIDGREAAGIENCGTFDVVVNGTLVADDVNDYWGHLTVGSSYQITDIKENGTHKYLGVHEGNLNSTIGTNANIIRLQYRTIDNIGDDFYAYIISNMNGKYVYNQGDHNVTVLPYKENLEAVWHFQRLDDGTYKITSAWDGYSLDVSNYGTTPGTNVHAYPYEGNTAQRWCIFQEDTGCKLSAVCTPCAMAVKASTGINVQMEKECNEDLAQWFQIVPVAESYSWDVNGLLDGNQSAGVDGYGTFDVWLNGEQVADDVPDYFNGDLPIGTSYEIRDIRVKEGRAYNGAYSGNLSGKIGGNHVFTVLDFSTAQPAQVGGPVGEVIANGHKYVYYADKTTWYAADAFCEAQGGHLVTVTSQEESDLLQSLHGENSIWLGGTDVETEGQWKWITGEPFEYANWMSGEPNNAVTGEEAAEHYLMVYTQGWNDINGSAEYGFVMEIEPGILEVNAYLDGQLQEGLSGVATVDVYADGLRVADDVENYRDYLSGGAVYEIRDIRPADGYSYDGLYSGSLTAEMSGAGQTVVLKFSTVQYDAIGEPEAELTWNGHRYVYYPAQTTWYTAKAFCEKLGGHLVTISSDNEESIVRILAPEAENGIWTGGTDALTEGTWEWITGEAFAYTNWRESTKEPNNSVDNDEATENYLVWEHDGWNDNPGCRLAPFICEFDEYVRYMISYDVCGGTNVPANQSKMYGLDLILSSTIPIRSGYTFLGWATSATATTAEYQPGDSFNVDADTTFYAVWEKNKPTVTLKYPSLSFKDEILLNVYFEATDMEDVVDMGLITYGSQVDTWNINNAEKVIPGYRYSEAKGMYVVTTEGIPAKNMVDTLWFAIYAKLSDGSYHYTKLVSYSPKMYADSLLGTDGEDLDRLLVSMLNYGAAAQLYFGYRTDELVNKDLTAEQRTLVSEYRSDMVTASGSVPAGKQGGFASNGGYTERYPSVSFKGAFMINYYCLPEAAPVDGVTLYYWTKDAYASNEVLTAENASGTVAMSALNGGKYSGSVTGIPARKVNDPVYVAFRYSDGTTTYNSGILPYSIGEYCGYYAGIDHEFTDMAKATAVYGNYAKQYFD